MCLGAILLQLLRLGTWLCSLGVPHHVRCCAGVGGTCLLLLCTCFVFCACCSIAVLFALRPLSLMRAFADDGISNAVDIYCDSTSAAACQAPPSQGTWSTAQLIVARLSLAAASVDSVTLFAGGAQSSA